MTRVRSTGVFSATVAIGITTALVLLAVTAARLLAVQSAPRLVLELEDYAALPITADNTDQNTRAQLARVNYLRDEPGGIKERYAHTHIGNERIAGVGTRLRVHGTELWIWPGHGPGGRHRDYPRGG